MQCVDLLAGMLDPDPTTRLTAAAALSHPFLSPLGGLSAPGASGLPKEVIERVAAEAEPRERADFAERSATLTGAAKMLESLEANMASA
jgi:serine/threonine protein kinase